MGVLGLAVLLLWSSLVFVMGRAFRPEEPAEPGPDAERAVLPWLVAMLTGLVLTLLWGDDELFGVPAVFVTVLPIVVAYSALLFDISRGQ